MFTGVFLGLLLLSMLSCTHGIKSKYADSEQPRIGIHMVYPKSQDSLFGRWYHHIGPQVIEAINVYCNKHVKHCCPGATIQETITKLEFTDKNGISDVKGYPINVDDPKIKYGSNAVVAMDVYGKPGNELCKVAL